MTDKKVYFFLCRGIIKEMTFDQEEDIKMLWIGIGVIIIGIAFFGLVILLIKPLNKLTGLFSSLQKTTDILPQTVNEITTQTKEAIGAGKDTLHEVNEQLRQLSP